MSENKGFLYEKQIYKKLKRNKLTPKNFVVAGADSNAPDAKFIHKNKEYNLELKLDAAADYGQLELRYDTKNKKWGFGGKNEALKDFYKSIGILELVEKEWGSKGAPKKELIDTKDFSWKDAEIDYKNFKDFYADVPLTGFFNHYAKKQTFYIQIGKLGFYYLKGNPAKLKVPQFSAQMQIRVRIKRRSSSKPNQYGFLVALKIKNKPKESTEDLDKSIGFLVD